MGWIDTLWPHNGVLSSSTAHLACLVFLLQFLSIRPHALMVHDYHGRPTPDDGTPSSRLSLHRLAAETRNSANDNNAFSDTGNRGAVYGAVSQLSNIQSVISQTRDRVKNKVAKCDDVSSSRINCSELTQKSVRQSNKVKRDTTTNGQYRTIEDVPDSASLRTRLNHFTFTYYNPNSTKPTTHKNNKNSKINVTRLTETSTVWDRSLIPNSFFPLSQSDLVMPSKGSTSVRKTSTFRPPPDRDLDVESSAERPRRSPPSSKINRAALHHGPPVRPVPRFRPLPPIPNHHGYVPHHNLAGAPVPMPMPYTQTQSFDYSGYGFGYGSAPDRHSHGSYNRVKRPAPPPMGRRVPNSYPSSTRPIPLPPPRYPPRPRLNGRPQPPLYSYPKNAGNIQDILTYFKESDNQPPPHYDPLLRPPKPPPMPVTPNPPRGGSEFSRELDDVQSSLMKDIREFAKRPTLMENPTSAPTYKPPTRSPPPPSYMQAPAYNNADDEIYEPKPKPVRELVKQTPHRFEDSAESHNNQKHQSQSQRVKDDRYRVNKDRDQSYEENKHAYRNRYKGYGHGGVDESDEGPPRPHSPHHDHRHHAHADHDYMEKPTRSKIRPKYPSGSTIRETYQLHKNEEYSNSEEWGPEYSAPRDRSPSMYVQTTKPIVLKRPYGPYRSENEANKPRPPPHHTYWDSSSSAEKDSYQNVPRVKAPSITYSPSKGSKSGGSYYKNMSPELIEDVVEIHTDPSYRIETTERQREEKERERKAHLHRLYLEYLERKLEAERQAIIEPPPTTPKSNPMRMKIHIYPNENVKVADPSRGTNNGNYYYHPAPPTVSYSNSNPTVVSPPSTRQYKSSNANYMGSHSHRVGVTGPSSSSTSSFSTGPQMGVDKNKNVVLHLHVHRRHGLPSGGMTAEASEIYTSTAKPLTYKEIYDDYQDLKHPTHKGSSLDITDDKSVSMELPIQDEKIDDVLHTLLQLRQQRNNQ